jgi:GNAT superfamily N-acetyltransferase
MIHIRKAKKSDMRAVHALVYELAVYEKAPDAVLTTVAEYEMDFENKVFDVLVAENEAQEVVGIMLYYLAYSTWKGKMVYLDDFVVRESARGAGIGALLWTELVHQSRKMGAKLLKWQVLDWNEPALNFYKKIGAEIETDWLNGKLVL